MLECLVRVLLVGVLFFFGLVWLLDLVCCLTVGHWVSCKPHWTVFVERLAPCRHRPVNINQRCRLLHSYGGQLCLLLTYPIFKQNGYAMSKTVLGNRFKHGLNVGCSISTLLMAKHRDCISGKGTNLRVGHKRIRRAAPLFWLYIYN